MKKKLMLAFLICSAFVLTFPSALAANNQVPVVNPMYVHVNTAKTSLSITQGTASCRGTIHPNSASYTIDATLTLKRKVGSSWVSVASWSDTSKNVKSIEITKTKALSVRGDYKLVLSAKIKNSSGTVLESISKTSSIKTY